MIKLTNKIETRRQARAKDEFQDLWWWFNSANQEHIHEFSAAWEILRRTKAYKALQFRIQEVCAGAEADVSRAGKVGLDLQAMLPQAPPAPRELREMVRRWQVMVMNGWKHDMTYLEVIANAETLCVRANGKDVHIPPACDFRNGLLPVILPRQVASKGHSALFVTLCEFKATSRGARRIHPIAGKPLVVGMLKEMIRHNMLSRLPKGKFVAVQFPLLHPPSALKPLFKSELDSLERNKIWEKRGDSSDEYCRPEILPIGTLNSCEAIALFRADLPRNVIERGFRTLIRPERIERILPKIRKRWIRWDSSERAQYSSRCSRVELNKRARAAWKMTADYGRLACESLRRPLRPKEDLDNLACADCAESKIGKRWHLPSLLPNPLRRDSDLNKRIKTGVSLVRCQDELFLPLLNLR